MEPTKACTKCGVVKPHSAFSKHRLSKDGHAYQCKECGNRRAKAWRKTPIGIYTNIKGRENFYHRAELLVSKEDFVEWYNAQPKYCVYCDIPEEKTTIWKKLFNHRSTKLSVDRKDSFGNYVFDNMALCCYLCNTIKNNVLSFDEMRYVGQVFLKPKWQNFVGKRR